MKGPSARFNGDNHQLYCLISPDRSKATKDDLPKKFVSCEDVLLSTNWQKMLRLIIVDDLIILGSWQSKSRKADHPDSSRDKSWHYRTSARAQHWSVEDDHFRNINPSNHSHTSFQDGRRWSQQCALTNEPLEVATMN